jgi:Holliday junction resolvasome RuvABC DNA-binding subunit
VEGGFGSIQAITGATVEQLSELPGIGEKTAEKILAAARGDREPDQEATAETEERS